VHGLKGILKGTNVVVAFKNLNGKPVAFHKAFNYLYTVPFRSREDLQPHGGFYQNALQKAHEDRRITNDMIEIAENIQTIHNSLASRIPQNSLSAEIKLTETGAFENANGDDDNENDDYEDLLASIGDLFLTLKNGDGLNTDSE
jgi:hypothetical protein